MLHVNYTDNKFFPEELEKERAVCEVKMHDDYQHTWLGGYKASNFARIALPYVDLVKCRQAGDYLPSGFCYMGLDVADGGADKPAYAISQGAFVHSAVELMNEKDGHAIAKTILPLGYTFRIARCYYDVTGVGASLKSEFARLKQYESLPFYPDPFLFGGKVKGGETVFASNTKKDQGKMVNSRIV